MSRSIIPDLKKNVVWFLTGSQDLYGPETLEQVAEQSKAVVAQLAASSDIPVTIEWKPVLKSSDAIRSQRPGGLNGRSSQSLLWGESTIHQQLHLAVDARAEGNAVYWRVASHNDPTSCSIKLSHSQSELRRDLWRKYRVCD